MSLRRMGRLRVRARGSPATIAPRLRTRLMITALIAVVPALCAIVYLQAVERREAEQRIGPDNVRLVRLAAGQYTGTLVGARRLLHTLAAVPLLASDDSAGCRKLMTAVLAGHSGYVNLTAANMDGTVFCSGKPMERQLLRRATGQSWFVRAIATRHSSLGDVQMSATSGRPALLLAEPVFDGRARIVHVLAAPVDLAALSDAIDPSTLPPRSTLTLFNRSGVILARTPRDGRIGDTIANPHLRDRALRGPNGWSDEHVASDGVRRLYTTIAVPDFPGLFVTLGVDHAAAYAEVDRILRRYVILLVLGSLAAMLAGAFGGQAFVVRPVIKLKRVMTRLASGDLSARASLRGAAYGLGELGDAVNAMAESLEQRYRERASAEHRLQATEDRLRFALEAANVGISEIELATGRRYWSPECEHMHGLATGAFQGTAEAFMACVHPDDRDEVRRRAGDASRSPALTTLTYRAVWPDGTVRTLASSLRFAFDQGRAVRGAGVVLDVTDRLQLEEQLRHSQKMEAVGQLAGGVAHDFNNLLTIILGNAELLDRDRAPAPHAWPELEEVRAAAKRAAELTRQLLAFSRKQTLALKRLDAGTIVDELVPMLRRLIGEDIEVRSLRDDVELGALLDRVHFEQALINIAVNARDAMPGGGVLAIEARLRELESWEIAGAGMELAPGPYVAIAFRDTGEGMPPEVLAHAFEPFFTTKEVGRGTGLGLSSVYGTIKQFGGHVVAASEPGAGTTVTIYLPYIDLAADADARFSGGAPVAAPAKTVLLVEDEDSVRRLTARLLTAAGYHVLAARNGDDAVAQSRAYAGAISLILTDVVMPGLPVGDMVAVLHRDRPRVPVLMMSGYSDSEIVRRGIMTNAVRFFHKPFESAELLSRVAASVRDAEHAVACDSL